MNMSDVYAIVDIEGYVKEMRDAAARSISTSCDENLDEFITVYQMISLVKENCIGFDDSERPLLDEDSNEKIYEHTVTWIHNVGLAKLAAKGLVECAWDENINEMVFWANPEITKTQKKKRKSNEQSIKRRNKKKDS
jgi:hypothetical protein